MAKAPWGGNPVTQFDHNGAVILPTPIHQLLSQSNGFTQTGHPTEPISYNPNFASTPYNDIESSYSRRTSPSVLTSSRHASIETHSRNTSVQPNSRHPSVEPNHTHQTYPQQLVQYSSRYPSAEPQLMIYHQPPPAHQHLNQSHMDAQHPMYNQYPRHPSAPPEPLTHPQTSYFHSVPRVSHRTPSPLSNASNTLTHSVLGPPLQSQVIPEEGQVVIQPAKVDERDFSNAAYPINLDDNSSATASPPAQPQSTPNVPYELKELSKTTDAQQQNVNNASQEDMYDQLDDISDTDDEAEENKELRGTLDNGLGNDDGNRMDEEDANSFYDEFEETDMQTGMLANGALASDEEKDVAAWSDEETPEDQRAILSKEKNAVTRERAMQEVPIILDAIATASKRSGADKTYFMKLLSALDNSPKAKAPHRWNLFNALFKSVTGRAYLVKFTNNHFKKRNMIIPKTVTAKVAYQVFLQRSDEQQLQALKMLQKLVANNEPVTLRKRKNEFQKITKLLKAYSNYVSELYDFETLIVLVGAHVNADGHLGAVIESPKILGAVKETFKLDDKLLVAGLRTKAYVSTFENAMASVEEDRKTIPMSEILGGACPPTSLPNPPTTTALSKQVQQSIDVSMEPPTPHQDEPDKATVKKKPAFYFVTDEGQLQSSRRQLSSRSDNELKSLAKSTMWNFNRLHAPPNSFFASNQPDRFPWRESLKQYSKEDVHLSGWPVGLTHPGSPTNAGINKLGRLQYINLILSLTSGRIKWNNFASTTYPGAVIVGESDGVQAPLVVYADAKYTNAIPARINPNPNFKRIDIFVYLDDTSYKPYAKLEDTGKQEPHVGQIKKSNKINNADTEDFKYNVDMLQGDEVDDDPQPSGSRYKTKSKAAKTLAAKLSARAPTEAEEIAPLGYSATLAANTRQTRSRMKEPSTTIENSSRQLRSRSRSKTPATPVKNGRNDHPLDETPKRSKLRPKSILKRPKIDDSDAEDTDQFITGKRPRFEHGAKPGDGSSPDRAANKVKDKANSKERGKGKASIAVPPAPQQAGSRQAVTGHFELASGWDFAKMNPEDFAKLSAAFDEHRSARQSTLTTPALPSRQPPTLLDPTLQTNQQLPAHFGDNGQFGQYSVAVPHPHQSYQSQHMGYIPPPQGVMRGYASQSSQYPMPVLHQPPALGNAYMYGDAMYAQPAGNQLVFADYPPPHRRPQMRGYAPSGHQAVANTTQDANTDSETVQQ